MGRISIMSVASKQDKQMLIISPCCKQHFLVPPSERLKCSVLRTLASLTKEIMYQNSKIGIVIDNIRNTSSKYDSDASDNDRVPNGREIIHEKCSSELDIYAPSKR